jgi:hypothetical protein
LETANALEYNLRPSVAPQVNRTLNVTIVTPPHRLSELGASLGGGHATAVGQQKLAHSGINPLYIAATMGGGGAPHPRSFTPSQRYCATSRQSQTGGGSIAPALDGRTSNAGSHAGSTSIKKRDPLVQAAELYAVPSVTREVEFEVPIAAGVSSPSYTNTLFELATVSPAAASGLGAYGGLHTPVLARLLTDHSIASSGSGCPAATLAGQSHIGSGSTHRLGASSPPAPHPSDVVTALGSSQLGVGAGAIRVVSVARSGLLWHWQARCA